VAVARTDTAICMEGIECHAFCCVSDNKTDLLALIGVSSMFTYVLHKLWGG